MKAFRYIETGNTYRYLCTVGMIIVGDKSS